MSIRFVCLELVFLENSVNFVVSEDVSLYDEINNYLQQIDQFKERIVGLEEEKQKNKEFSQILENERNVLLSQILIKDGELKLFQEEVSKMNLLNQ